MTQGAAKLQEIKFGGLIIIALHMWGEIMSDTQYPIWESLWILKDTESSPLRNSTFKVKSYKYIQHLISKTYFMALELGTYYKSF